MNKDIKKYLGIAHNFFKKNGWWLQYLVLILIILIGVYIRVQPIPNLVDQTTGEYISLELDSTYFYRLAQEIAQNGKLNETDSMVSAPLGQPNIFYEVYTAYFVAYLWKVLSFFDGSLTVEYVDLIYPILATAIMSLFLFLLLRRILGWKVALLSTLILNVIPSFLFRSLGGSSDHDILVMMFVVMVFYFYFVAWQSTKLRNNILFAVITGLLTYFADISGGASLFIFTIIGITVLINILLNKFDKKDFYVLLIWLLTFSILIQFFGIGVKFYLMSLTTIPAYFALLVGFFDFILFKLDYYKYIREHVKYNLPNGIISLIFSVVFGFIFALIFIGINNLIANFLDMYTYVFKAFQYGRVGITVAENRRSYVVDLFAQFGVLYVWLFILGMILLFFKSMKSLSNTIRNKLVVVFTVFLLLYIFSRYSSNSVLNGESTLSQILLIGGIFLFLIYYIYTYFRSYYKDPSLFKSLHDIEHKYLFIIIWGLIMAIASTTAIRLFFEFSVIFVILVAYFFVFVIDLFSKLEYTIVKYLGVLAVLLILFSPFSFAKGFVYEDYERSFNQAKFSGPGYNTQWQLAGKWARENTDVGSTFVHWWDYGYWVQSGFDRPTVTDGGNKIHWWNHLIGRNVLTETNLTIPLKFMKAHNVSHLLIINDEIGKYPAYSSIGSDEKGDKTSYLVTYLLDPANSKETRNSTLLFYRGGFPLDEDFVYNGQVYPKGQAGIGAVILPIQNVENSSLVIGQPSVILVHGNQQITLSMKCVYIDRIYNFDNYSYPGCFRVMPLIRNNQANNFGAGILISPKVTDTLFARLFLFNEKHPNYELAYDDSYRTPLALYNGVMIGPLKIWEINYPNNLTLTEEELEFFLRTTYPDENLSRV
ncbi:glycosyltransferase family 39 protein [Candidatus Woesearchaeota archaeon]|nr:glycosyltransferase family 39 protein [Candidatus Woesearchaeota archaeon]